MHANMDADVRALLESGYDDVLHTFRDHRQALEALADALLEQETLSGDEATAVLHATGMIPRVAAA